MKVLHKAFLDTNLYVDWLNAGEHEHLILGRGLVRYLSSVVELELRVGAGTRAARRALESLVRPYAAGKRLVAPGPSVFREAGEVLRSLSSHGHQTRRASLVHDVLLALTCRAEGARLYTRDREDMEAIRKLRRFDVEYVT